MLTSTHQSNLTERQYRFMLCVCYWVFLYGEGRVPEAHMKEIVLLFGLKEWHSSELGTLYRELEKYGQQRIVWGIQAALDKLNPNSAQGWAPPQRINISRGNVG